jgi:hypothetical protein
MSPTLGELSGVRGEEGSLYSTSLTAVRVGIDISFKKYVNPYK